MIEIPNLLIETPPSPNSIAGPNGTDVLSDVLRVFRVTGAALLRGDFTAPWAWTAPPTSAVASMLHPPGTRLVIFHIIVEGSCWIETEGSGPVVLQAGDVVGFPHGHAHSMGAGAATARIPISELFPPPPWTELPVLQLDGGGPTTRIVCVYLHCDDLLCNPVLDSLPSVLVARSRQRETAQWMDISLRYLVAAMARGGAGSACLLARMTELLFIEMLRIHLAELEEQATGWLAALKDRHISRVLHLLHSEPSRPWKTETLAREAGLSRSAFDERFRRLLGTSPGRYMATWRLQLAAQKLRHTQESITRIADRTGYGSEEAFSRAFKRFAGRSPGAWRASAGQNPSVQAS